MTQDGDFQKKDKEVYTQCRLKKSTDLGYIEDMAWVPSCMAIPGKKLRVRVDGMWEEGWVVVEAFSKREWGDIRQWQEARRSMTKKLEKTKGNKR